MRALIAVVVLKFAVYYFTLVFYSLAVLIKSSTKQKRQTFAILKSVTGIVHGIN